MTDIELAETLAALTRLVATADSSGPALADHHQLVPAALGEVLRLVPGAQWASVTLQHDGYFTAGSTDPVAEAADQLQYQTGQGPCLDACATRAVCLTAALATEERWPALTPDLLARTPVRTVLSQPLPAAPGHYVAGSLNIYGDRPDGLRADALAAAPVAAGVIAIALIAFAERYKSEHLGHALHNSRQIGTAIGILMHAHKTTDEDAFDLLRLTSQRLHRKLHDIADEVTRTGALPDARSWI